MAEKATKTLTELRNEFRPYYFDREAAARVVRFFERELTHRLGDLAGQPFKLERWQRYILRHFYGWKHRETGLRKYKVLYLEIPRKNGKSILAAGLSLYHLDADSEPAARVVCFALNEDQSREAVFDVAKEMVHANRKLSSRISTYRNSMAVKQTASNFQLLSGATKGKHGKNLSAMVGDEVHEWDNRDAMDALRTSMVTRSQPVEIYLTTAGFDRNSICYELHDYAKKVKEGIVEDPAFMGVIFAADDDDDWTDEKTWAKANPNLGVSVRLEYLRTECKKAMQLPSYENTFKRLHLNIWTEQDSRWIPIETWNKCKVDFSEADLLNQWCIAGIDLGSTNDMTCVSLLFPLNDGRFRVLPYYFVPANTVPRRTKEHRVPYESWAKQGLMTITPGDVCDYEAVRLKVNELNKKFNIREVVADKWNALHLCTLLQNDSFEVIYFGQGFASLAAPTKELEKLVLSKQFEHNGNKILEWNAKNVAIEQDAAGNMKPSKKRSKEKIDGIAATINALGRAIAIIAEGPSVYESRGIRTM